jgi:antitoxin VapB
MALSIKDHKTDQLARKISQLTGESLTEAIQHSLEARLLTLEKNNKKGIDLKKIQEIQARVRSKLPKGANSLDHGDFLYDKNGLPR